MPCETLLRYTKLAIAVPCRKRDASRRCPYPVLLSCLRQEDVLGCTMYVKAILPLERSPLSRLAARRLVA